MVSKEIDVDQIIIIKTKTTIKKKIREIAP